jgi:hypothetical protein
MKRKDAITEKPASELIMQLSAMNHFPVERAGVEALAAALNRSACDTGIRMQAILDDILAGGAWCPTPYDLRGVAVAMKDREREKREGSKHAQWERIYGPANPKFARDLLAQLSTGSAAQDRQALHERAIRDMLYYSEGDGRLLGDSEYWRESSYQTLSAADIDARDYAALVASIRERGGWRTERELQQP